MNAITRAADRLDASTPPERERAIDGLRALALTGVVVGHWMVGGLVMSADGLVITSPLAAMPWLSPASWVLQMLGLFFLVGGRVSAVGWDRARGRVPEAGRSGRSAHRESAVYRTWLRARLTRLTRPVLAVVVAGGTVLPVLSVAGVPHRTLLSAVTLVVQPLWFVAVYLGMTALTRVLVAADRRWGLWACVPGVLVVAAVDLARYGPWADQVPGGIAWLTVLPGYGVGYQLGIAWAAGRFGRLRAAWLLAGTGAALFAVLVTVGGYPSSMVGVPGEARGNAHPPSLLVVALALAQSGVAIAARHRLEQLLRRRVLWAGIVAVNLAALSILCWHQVAALIPSVAAAQAGWEVPGLTDAPDSPAWLLARLAWFPLLLVLLVALCLLARPFESGRASDALKPFSRLRRRAVPSGSPTPPAASPAARARAAQPPRR